MLACLAIAVTSDLVTVRPRFRLTDCTVVDVTVSSLAQLAGAVIGWRDHGVRIIKSTELDPNTAQTPGMTRAAAINHAKAGAEKTEADSGDG